MSQPSPPALTVSTDNSRRTFAPGSDVVIGRDLRADVRITHPQVSRAHVILRYDGGRWIAVDNDSRNGTYVNGQRVPTVDLRDGQSIQIGNPEDGPRLTFEIGRQQQGPIGSPPQTTVTRIPLSGPLANAGPTQGQVPAAAGPTQIQDAPPPAGPTQVQHPSPAGPTQVQHPSPAGPTQVQFPAASAPTTHQPVNPPSPGSATHIQRQPMPPHRPASGPIPAPGVQAPAPNAYRPSSPSMRPPSAPQQHASRPPSQPMPSQPQNWQQQPGGTVMAPLPPTGGRPQTSGSITIGREVDNDIVVADVLASRHHATLLAGPSGWEIQDERSSNGTFVNGVRVMRAFLNVGDTVTIGNIDLVFDGTTLVRRSETEAATSTGGLDVRGVTFTIEGNKTLLNNISIAARPGTLTAVIGPSGAGKSTFARLIAGYTQPTSGTVTFEGHNIHAEYASLRSRIGMVPQDDVVHGQLTVRQALMFAAELRLPPDTTKQGRAEVVAQVLEELELTKHADTRVEKLSGGQRKRASVALELLTGPSLLILDEPTTGLDPALDRQVMSLLRQLADAGRCVLVVTHSLSYLDVCDHVLLLAPGGKTAFFGAPAEIGPSLGTTNWADIFGTVADDPDGAHHRYLAQHGPQGPPPPAVAPKDFGSPTRSSARKQFSTIARRQIKLLLADRGYFIFLALLPFIMGSLVATVPGDAGFGIADPLGEAPTEVAKILSLLNLGSVLMGTTLTVRAIIGEKRIFQREQAAGLSTNAYLLAKIAVFSVFAVIQSTILVAIMVAVKGPPTQGAVVLGNATFELWFGVAFTTVAAAIMGLAISALVTSNNQIMPLLVVSTMSQLVFSGGTITISGRPVLEQISWITPARWGFALSSSTVDVQKVLPAGVFTADRHWDSTPAAWLWDALMLLLVCIGYAAIVRWKIRLKK